MAKKRRAKTSKNQPEVWVSPDLTMKLKGTGAHRGGAVPHSPYLALADRFLGLMPNDPHPGRAPHRSAPAHPTHKTREATAPEPLRAMSAAASAGMGAEPMITSSPARMIYPKPAVRPKPPKLMVSKPPARPKTPRLQPPKPPKVSFGYRRPKI